jgi:hypothetical protein
MNKSKAIEKEMQVMYMVMVINLSVDRMFTTTGTDMPTNINIDCLEKKPVVLTDELARKYKPTNKYE